MVCGNGQKEELGDIIINEKLNDLVDQVDCMSDRLMAIKIVA